MRPILYPRKWSVRESDTMRLELSPSSDTETFPLRWELSCWHTESPRVQTPLAWMTWNFLEMAGSMWLLQFCRSSPTRRDSTADLVLLWSARAMWANLCASRWCSKAKSYSWCRAGLWRIVSNRRCLSRRWSCWAADYRMVDRRRVGRSRLDACQHQIFQSPNRHRRQPSRCRSIAAAKIG